MKYIFLLFCLTFTAFSQIALFSPRDRTRNVPLNIDLIWSTGIGWGTTANGDTLYTVYDVQVATDRNFSNIIVEDSTLLMACFVCTDQAKKLTGLSNATDYFWRVRSKSPLFNSWSAWTIAWQFTTLMSSPSIISPHLYGISLSPTLKWSSVSGASSYDIQVSSDDLFSKITFADSFIAGTSRSITGLSNGTEYWWQVRARSPAGIISDWSQIHFTTILKTPTMLLPANNSNNISLSPTFTWSSITSSNSFSYYFQLSSDSLFSNIIAQDSTLSLTSKSISGLLSSTIYYWRIQSKVSSSGSGWSSAWKFFTLPKVPETPILVAPENGLKWINCTPGIFSVGWQNSPGVKYSVQIANNSSFLAVISSDTALCDTHSTVKTIYYNFTSSNQPSTYFWRVCAHNAAGESAWSNIWCFYTGGMPPAPKLIAPIDAAIISAKTTLIWNTVFGGNPTIYEIQVSKANSFSTLVCDSFVGYTVGLGYSNDTTLDLTLPLGLYYWRAKTWVSNSPVTSQWSSVNSFSVSTTSCNNFSIKKKVTANDKFICFDILGHKTTRIKPQGIYILNGKKIFICRTNFYNK